MPKTGIISPTPTTRLERLVRSVVAGAEVIGPCPSGVFKPLTTVTTLLLRFTALLYSCCWFAEGLTSTKPLFNTDFLPSLM